MIRILLTRRCDVNKIHSQEDTALYICICHGITDNQIRTCVQAGARTLQDLSGRLGVATQCGSCAVSACEVLDEVIQASSPPPAPVAPLAQALAA
jgi:bacterioferritin-associated ferredoxin